MKRVMLDLETLSTTHDALILSIGAVVFDETLGLGSEFYTAVAQTGQQEEFGRHVSINTIRWWAQQSKEAQDAALNVKDAPPLEKALEDFTTWFLASAGKDAEIWGNGSEFDNVILGNAFRAVGYEPPWAFYNSRCFRTLKNLGIKLPPGTGFDRKAMGTHHNALADAKYQAHYAVAYLRALSPVPA